MPVLEADERRELEVADQAFANMQRVLEQAADAGALDSDVLDRLKATVDETARRLNANLPPLLEAHESEEVRTRLISLLTVKLDGGLDAADHVLIEMEAIRHILRDLLQEQPPIDVLRSSAVIQQIESWLPGIAVGQLGALLACSDRQVQRKRTSDGPSSDRDRLVLRLVSILRSGWTTTGVVAWFYRERRDLGGVAPISLLDDPVRERDVVLAARAGRVQGGV